MIRVIGDTVGQILLWALPVLAAVVFHEVAHGWVAFRLGDPTAARLGRLTLNPLSHIDLVGTILIPLVLILARAPFLFGYAKPVPVNFFNLRHPKRDMIWVALAGPVTNLLLALGSVLFLKFLLSLGSPTQDPFTAFSAMLLNPFAKMAQNSVVINIVLAVFNAFPIPPLDGGRVLVGLLPRPHSVTVARLEPYGILIVLILLMTDVLDVIMGPAVHFLLKMFYGIL